MLKPLAEQYLFDIFVGNLWIKIIPDFENLNA